MPYVVSRIEDFDSYKATSYDRPSRNGLQLIVAALPLRGEKIF